MQADVIRLELVLEIRVLLFVVHQTFGQQTERLRHSLVRDGRRFAE